MIWPPNLSEQQIGARRFRQARLSYKKRRKGRDSGYDISMGSRCCRRLANRNVYSDLGLSRPTKGLF